MLGIAASLELAPAGIKIVGMGTTSRFNMYPRAKEFDTSCFERQIALPGQIFERAKPVPMWRGAEQARKNPDRYRTFPGLGSSEHFFLASARFEKGKNLAGLIQAYKQYRRKVCEEGKIPWRLVILGDGIDEFRPGGYKGDGAGIV